MNLWEGKPQRGASATKPNYSPCQAQPNQDTQVRETKNDRSPNESEEQIPLWRLEINHQGYKVEGRGR